MTTRVLVVESDELLAETYRRFLNKEGFQVRTATSPDECVKSMLEFAPDVVMLEPDVMASRVGPNVQFASCNLANVPIVIVTKHDVDRSRMPQDWRVARHYTKPISLARLAKAIREVAKEHARVS